MIRRIYGALPPDYPSGNVIVGRINAYCKAYGTGYDFCTFYEGDTGDNMLAFITAASFMFTATKTAICKAL